MPFVNVNDINLFYEIYGAGEPLVLIEGFGADHNYWIPIINILKKKYQIIAIDNRGSGKSDSPIDPYTVEIMADDVAAILQSLQVSCAHFIGNSLGGCIVQTLAYCYPKLTKSIVLSNTFRNIHARARLFLENGLKLISCNAPADVLVNYGMSFIFSNDFLGNKDKFAKAFAFRVNNPHPFTTLAYKNQFQALKHFDSSGWLDKIKCQTLVVTADEDLLADYEESIAIAKIIPNAQYFCFKKVGHAPYIEQSESFCKLIDEFYSVI